MKKKPLTIRKQRSDEHRRQYRLLNALRLAYFLHPDKLTSDGANDGNDMEYISSLYKKCRWPDESNDGEMMFYIRSNNFWTNYVRNELGPKSPHINWESYLDEHLKKFSQHWRSPENVPAYYKEGLPKVVDFDTFVKKVITHHQFELKKCRTKTTQVEKQSMSYADILTKQKTHLGVSVQYANQLIRHARGSEKKMEGDGKRFDDKFLAQEVYEKVNAQTLARVRQDRKRLKKYGLL